jgi:hypothetical protein
MKKRLSILSVIIVSCSAILVGASLFFPWWGMRFVAPQYPEGLDIIVYPNKLKGNIDIINGLNHYIGMKPFSEETFPELSYLPYIIGVLAVFLLVVAWLRDKRLLVVLTIVFAIGGLLGLYDLHRWLVDFGTNLSEDAPIKIEPFVPPVLGENRIANFVTNSYFSTGAYMIGVAFFLLILSLWKERNR